MRFLLGLLLVFLTVSECRAGTLKVASVSGTCTIVQMWGRTALCADPAKLVYTVLPNDIVMFTIVLEDDTVVSFVGGRDSQPSPEKYTLYLSRVRFANSSAVPDVVSVEGRCDAQISEDGTIFYSVVCNASSARGETYLLSFRGDGKPVAPSYLTWGPDSN